MRTGQAVSTAKVRIPRAGGNPAAVNGGSSSQVGSESCILGHGNSPLALI